MNLETLNPMELSLVSKALEKAVYKRPQLKNIGKLSKDVKKLLKKRRSEDTNYKKGEALLKLAEENGIDDGYASPSDYFFAVRSFNITNSYGNNDYTELLLCFKFQWFMNGETYDPVSDGFKSRDFELPEEIYGDEDECDYEINMMLHDAAFVREVFTKAGYEEKPELVTHYDAYIKARDKQRR